MEDQTLTAVMAISAINAYRSTLTLIIELTREPREAIRKMN